MSLSEQQNQALTSILIDFYNNLLIDMSRQVFQQQCKRQKIEEMVQTLQFQIIDILKQSTSTHFQQTKSQLFDYISQQQRNVKLTEQAFKNIFDKYLIPPQLLSQYKNKPNDIVLQMGMNLIVANIKTLFLDAKFVKLCIKQLKIDSLDDQFYINPLSDIIQQIQPVMHKQLLGIPEQQQVKQVLSKESTCQRCKKLKERLGYSKQTITLMQEKNKELEQQLQVLYQNMERQNQTDVKSEIKKQQSKYIQPLNMDNTRSKQQQTTNYNQNKSYQIPVQSNQSQKKSVNSGNLSSTRVAKSNKELINQIQVEYDEQKLQHSNKRQSHKQTSKRDLQTESSHSDSEDYEDNGEDCTDSIDSNQEGEFLLDMDGKDFQDSQCVNIQLLNVDNQQKI